MNLADLKSEISLVLPVEQHNVSVYVSTNDGDISFNAEQSKSAASVIKVPIAMACLEAADKGEIDLHKQIHIHSSVAGTGVLHYLYGMKTLSLLDALTLSIIVSDNTAANIVIKELGMGRLQDFFARVGAVNTHLRREFMDHRSLQAGIDNLTTAKDMAACMKCLSADSDVLSADSKQLMRTILHHQQLRDKLPAYQNMFGEKIVIGNKSGTLNGVEHDIGYFQNEKQTIYAAVLSDNWKFNHDGQQIIAQVGSKILEYMS